MSTPEWDRRAAVAACGALGLLALVAPEATRAQSGLPLRNIRVDVAPLRATTPATRRRLGSSASCPAASLDAGWPPHSRQRWNADTEDRLSWLLWR
jgi:hypothetical protein